MDDKCIMNMINNINKLPKSVLESRFALMKQEDSSTDNNLLELLRSNKLNSHSKIFSMNGNKKSNRK